MKDAEAVVRTLLKQGVPAEQVSIVGALVVLGPLAAGALAAAEGTVVRHQPEASDTPGTPAGHPAVEIAHHEDLIPTATRRSDRGGPTGGGKALAAEAEQQLREGTNP